jgi:hypothetical protein
MIMAFITWMLMKMGIAPSVDDYIRMGREFRERGHHMVLDVGGTRVGWTRWNDDDNFRKQPTIGLGYEYLIDRRFHGSGFEILAQSQGRLLRDGDGRNSFFIGGGPHYYPIRNLRLFMQAGAQIDTAGHAVTLGRVGLGYRFMFFKCGMQPYVYVQQDSKGQPGWAMNFRFEY